MEATKPLDAIIPKELVKLVRELQETEFSEVVRELSDALSQATAVYNTAVHLQNPAVSAEEDVTYIQDPLRLTAVARQPNNEGDPGLLIQMQVKVSEAFLSFMGAYLNNELMQKYAEFRAVCHKLETAVPELKAAVDQEIQSRNL